MTQTYIERRLNIKLSERDQAIVEAIDPDIVKYCTDRVMIRHDVVNKLEFILATSRQVRKEVNQFGTFIVNGITKTKIDSNQQQLGLGDIDTLEEETFYQPQGHSYSRGITVSSSHQSKLSPKERDDKLARAKENYARYQEIARQYKERIEMKPIQIKPFELVRNPDYVDRGDPKSSIQRCVERLGL